MKDITVPNNILLVGGHRIASGEIKTPEKLKYKRKYSHTQDEIDNDLLILDTGECTLV